MPPRSNQVRCRCKSHCTIFNVVTGRYEGDGILMTRGMRDNHTADDRRRANRAVPQLITMPTTLQAQPAANWSDIIREELDALAVLPTTSAIHPLVFVNRPEENGEFVSPRDGQIVLANQGLYALTGHRANHAFLSTEYRLSELFRSLMDHDELEAPDLLDHILRQWKGLICEKAVQWGQQRGGTRNRVPYMNTNVFFQPKGPRNPTLQAASLISLVMENIYFMPRRSLRVLLAGFKDTLRLSGAPLSTVNALPRDPRTTDKGFELDPIVRQYISCPNCHRLYPYNSGDGPDTVDVCTYARTPESTLCNTALWHPNSIDSLPRPIKKYYHQELKAWVGRLLSRPGIEDILDQYPQTGQSDDGVVDDIWQSRIFSDLKDNNGAPFFPGPQGEGRLIFSMSVDGFNPFYNKTAKQSVSSTGIWLVLLNLPPHLRYLPENMYVAGVIPGPDKPSKEDIYPYLELVVADLIEFWTSGVYFSRTHREILGRLFRAMLIPLVCDMLGARQVSGAPAVTSHGFCTMCDLDRDDINISDRSQWPAKDPQHVRHFANLWRDAANEKAQDDIFEACGIRWTPLLDLPYWDPILYVIIDTMHTLDLNLFQNHVRNLFQIDSTRRGGDISSILPSREVRKPVSNAYLASLNKCVRLVRANPQSLLTDLLTLPRPILYDICVHNGITAEGRSIVIGIKWVLASNIVSWRRRPTYRRIVLPSLSRSDAPIHIRNDNTRSLPEMEGVDLKVASRVIGHIMADENNEDDPRAKAFSQGSTKIFSYICAILQIPRVGIDDVDKTAKRALFNKVIETVDSDIAKAEELASYLQRKSSTRALLGIDVLEKIWSDMERTQLPTWITPASSNWGTPQRGKLSANHWRVICTIHLPITLISLWHDDEGMKPLLDHFMDLVAAVKIANMHRSSPAQVQAYNFYIERYVANLTKLYPDQALKPTHHGAMHIGDMLDMFGPTQSHSAAHYERYINFFHRVNINMKFGELESTLLKMSSRSANLRALLNDDEEVRHNVENMIATMDSIVSEDLRGHRLASVLDPRLPAFSPRSRPFRGPLDGPLHRLFCEMLGRVVPNNVTFLREVSVRDVCYGIVDTVGSTSRNSSIIFTHNRSQSAGIIQRIFQQSGETFLIARRLDRVQNSQRDPFSEYGIFGGFLCIKDGGPLHVLRVSQIESHFALTELTGTFENLIHVLPIDRLIYQFDLPGDAQDEANE